jgi:hypothetical protein
MVAGSYEHSNDSLEISWLAECAISFSRSTAPWN